jgi:YjjG family noncanonical pyrimidine nucleotidase
MTKYRAILFDLDDTLIDFHACEFNSLEAAFRIIGPTIEQFSWSEIWAVYEPINAGYWRQRNRMSRDQVVEHSIRDTLQAIDKGSEMAPAIAQEYWSLFCETAYVRQGAQETLGILSEQYRLGLVTNGYTEAQRGRLRVAGLLPYFDVVVVSEEIGYSKPDSRIFEHATRELQVSSAETLFVGDSVEHDYRGAMNAGIDFCYYRTSNVPMDMPVPPKFEINALKELVGLLVPKG